jgi:mono/diheme cytochrome c family protein
MRRLAVGLLIASSLSASAQDKAKQEEERKAAQALAEAKKKDPLSFDHNVRGLFNRYCYRCHNAEKQRGDVNLARDENPRLIAQNRKTWQTVIEMLEKGEMPPKKEPQPADAQRKNMVDFVRTTLDTLDCAKPKDPGRPVVRRLNRAEYDASILALTGLDLRLAEGFSPDASGYGFDNIAEALALSPVLVEQYHQAARKAVDAVAASPEAWKRVFAGDGIRRIAERLASAAFRRPADPSFVDRLVALHEKARAKGESPEAALRPLLLAVLISPRFLMRIETVRPDAPGAYPVDDHDLASRLSFFLWSGPPDETLLDLAAKGALSRPEALEAQARRMLADPRSRALVDNFFSQWLQLRGLSSHAPDPKAFPGFGDPLRKAMQQELSLFLGEIVRKDRPLTELVDAPYTFVNEELARHYGLDGVRGPEFRRVDLPDRRRGGVLTSAAVLMLQSDTERNNVPRRGNWIAGTILGTPPPPPPPDVPSLEDSRPAGKELTLRQLLELHRSKPECAGCHSRIDPLGFSLQNFDAIGRWRDREAGAPVDASGVLPDGRAFRGPVELKQILLERKDAFARTLAENLLIYAMGRGLELEDECVLRDALKAAAANEYRFSSIVLAIVRSHPFRHRRNPDF